MFALKKSWIDGIERRFKALTFARALLPTMVALVVQFFAFVLTARGLGAEQFGLYTAVLAISLIGGDIVGLGAIELLMRATARDTSLFRRYFGHLLWATAGTYPLIVVAAFLTAVHVMRLPLGPEILICAIAAEIAVGRALVYLEGVLVAQSDPVRAAWVRLAGAICRLAAAFLYFIALGRSDLEGWIMLIAGLAVVTAVTSYGYCVRRFGGPNAWFAGRELGAGLVLCLTQIAFTVQANVDRIVLSRFATPLDVGSYGAAMRIQQLGLFPLQVATRITYPRFFLAHNLGPRPGLRFAVRVAMVMFAVGLVAFLLVAGASLTVPFVLGKDFTLTQPIVLLLALSLPAIALQTPPADVLTASNRHSSRAACYWVGAVGFMLLAYLCVSYGAFGIALAYVATQVMLAAGLWGVLLIAARRSPAGPVQHVVPDRP